MTARTDQEPQVEDAEVQAEWEHMARIRAERLPQETVPAAPYDCEHL